MSYYQAVKYPVPFLLFLSLSLHFHDQVILPAPSQYLLKIIGYVCTYKYISNSTFAVGSYCALKPNQD